MNGRLDRKTFMTTLGAAGLSLGLTAARGGPEATLAQTRATPAAAANPDCGAGLLDEWLQRREQFYADFTAALADHINQGGMRHGQEGMQGGQGSMQGGGMQGGTPPGQGGMQGGNMQGANMQGGNMQGGNMQGGNMQGANMQGGGMPSGAEAVDAAIREALMAMLDAWHRDSRLTYGQAEALKTLIATSPAPIGPGPLGPALFGSAAGAMHAGLEGMQGAMPGMGGMEGGGMRAGQGGMAPAQKGQGERHGRGNR